MAEYLPLTNQRAEDRSRLEAMQRAAGLQSDSVTQFWHAWIQHPITGQEALVINSAADKEFLTQAELDSLLTEQIAESTDWFVSFEEDIE